MGRAVSQCRVPHEAVVERLDVLENPPLCLCRCLVPLEVNKLRFQGMEERLGYGVIVAVALVAHTLDGAATLQGLPEGSACVLAATVRVKDKPRGRSTPHYGLIESP